MDMYVQTCDICNKEFDIEFGGCGCEKKREKTVYKLIIKERDDYFYYHNTLICKILTIDASDTKTTEHITVVNGAETRRNVVVETMVNGKYTNVPDSDEIFDSLESLKEYLEKEYKLVYTDKYHHFFLDTEEMDTVFTITNIKGQTGMGICSDHINLQDLLGLDASGQKGYTPVLQITSDSVETDVLNKDK